MVRMFTNGHEGERLTAVLSSCRQYFNNRETPSTDSLIRWFSWNLRVQFSFWLFIKAATSRILQRNNGWYAKHMSDQYSILCVVCTDTFHRLSLTSPCLSLAKMETLRKTKRKCSLILSVCICIWRCANVCAR